MGLDRLAAGGQLAQGRRIEIAVRGQRECARDRRRGHVQCVRDEAVGRLAVQHRALADAEAVLLVDDVQRKVAELDGRLDERVGPDEQVQLAGGQAPEDLAPPRRRRRAGQQRDRDQPAEQAVERGEVLLGERLGRRHQGGLAAVLEGTEHRP